MNEIHLFVYIQDFANGQHRLLENFRDSYKGHLIFCCEFPLGVKKLFGVGQLK